MGTYKLVDSDHKTKVAYLVQKKSIP